MSRIAGAAALALIALTPSCGSVEMSAREERATLERYGVAVTLPPGWHAKLTRATVEAATTPVIPSGNDVSLGDADLFVRVFECEPEPEFLAEWQRTHPAGHPRPFTAAEFGPPDFRGDNPKGHSFAQRNFSLAGRYFDLFVESGAATPPEDAVAGLNELVGSLEVRAGDFYPGTIEPPRFALTDGWHVGSYGGGEVRAADFASAWAATIPYRNGPRDLPPFATLETLQPDGILIWVGFARENRFPPTDELRKRRPLLSAPLRARHAQGGFGWRGRSGRPRSTGCGAGSASSTTSTCGSSTAAASRRPSSAHARRRCSIGWSFRTGEAGSSTGGGRSRGSPAREAPSGCGAGSRPRGPFRSRLRRASCAGC
jgi:hypothetical protein